MSLTDGKINKKLKPYQVLVLLLYGTFPDWAEWDGPGVTIRLGPLARLIGVTNYRLIGYLQWLETMGFIEDLEHTHGKASLKLVAPPSKEGGKDA